MRIFFLSLLIFIFSGLSVFAEAERVYIGTYQEKPCIKLVDFISQYFIPVILTFLILFFLITIIFYILFLNRQLKKSESRLKKLTSHDPLTGLPNRRFFQEFAEHTIELCRRRGCRMALYYIDLDNFKPVNDKYGHAIGDLLLHEVGDRLKKQMRKSDLCARIGGDEFIALIQDVKDDQGFDKVARRIIEELSRYYLINDKEISVGVSLGISFFPDQSSNVQDLILKADKALSNAKASGRGRYRIYTEV